MGQKTRTQIPITVNYLSECFVNNIVETGLVLNAARLLFGLSIVFYVNAWVSSVGLFACYGTMGCIQVFAWVFIIALLLRGHRIRQYNPFGLIVTEEGEHVLKEEGL